MHAQKRACPENVKTFYMQTVAVGEENFYLFQKYVNFVSTY